MTEHTYLDEKEAATFLHRAVPTLRTWRSRGHGPEFIKDGMGKVTYRKQDLINFIEGDNNGTTQQADG